jgi:zinc and cadmium transporter
MFLPLAAVIIVSLISFVGIFTVSLREPFLKKVIFFFVSLAVGAMFGDAFLHILPEAFRTDSQTPPLFVLFGILSFFILEKFLHWRHEHISCDCTEHNKIQPVGYLNLIADGVHNFLDGILIGVSFLASTKIGLATTLAVILHEIPQELSDFGVLLHAGFTRRRALLFNFLSALTAVFGTLTALFLSNETEKFSFYMLPFAAGCLIYVAGSDLMPELHKENAPKKALLQFAGMLLGILSMLGLKFLE